MIGASLPELRFAAEARADLLDIYRRGLRTRSPEQALLFAESIESRCEVFLTNPALGVALPESSSMRAFAFDRLITVVLEADASAVTILRLIPRGADLNALVRGLRS